MIDSHFHLVDSAFDADLPEVVSRAKAAGVRHGLCMVTAGDSGETERARKLAALWPDVRMACGVHPHVAGHYAGRADEVVAIVRAAIEAVPEVRAIGEIGLDYHYDFSPRDVQREVFRQQVLLARELSLPVVIHTRESTEDTLTILRRDGRGVTGVFHCFSGDEALAREAVALGFCVSFAGILTFPRAESVRQAARQVPGDYLLVETDAPYLAPVPHRGQRNEPAFVTHTLEALARARGEEVETVDASVTQTFERLFRP